MKTFRALLPLVFISFGQAFAQAVPPPNATVQMIAPVFHEYVLFSLPGTFQVTAREQTNSASYLREIPLRGETVEHWTQLVTLSGANGMASKPGVTVQTLSQNLVSQYQAGCPDTFGVMPGTAGKISGVDAEFLLMGCGSVQDKNGRPGAMHSETTLMVVLKGSSDVYTLQWAQHGPSVQGHLKIDSAPWIKRMAILQPIKVCPLAGGTAGCLKQ